MGEENKSMPALVDAALEKVSKIRNGNVFVGDLEAANLLEKLAYEVQWLQAKLRDRERILEYYKLYVEKRLTKQGK